MESIRSIIKSNYRGSLATAKAVAEEIARRWGDAVAAEYDPYTSVLSYKKWLEFGFKVRRGEKAIKSITFVEKKDKDGEVISTYPRNVFLFHRCQVDPITN